MDSFRLPTTLVLAIPLFLATGCAVEDDPAPEDSPGPGIVEEVDSPVHDIRVAEGDWSGMPTTAEVFLAPDNREGWTFSWRVGGGAIDGSGREVVWTTPLADSCWIESTIRRDGEEHLSRHWIHLRNETPTLRLEAGGEVLAPGSVGVEAIVNRPLPGVAHLLWGDDLGTPSSGSATHRHWEVCARGTHRVWATLVLGPWVLTDTLAVEVANVPPDHVAGSFWEGPAPLGGVVVDRIRVSDRNGDPLVLELVDLAGLEFVDTTWVAHDSSSEFQGHWDLTLRHVDGQPGLRELRFRVGDGLAWTPGNLWFAFE